MELTSQPGPGAFDPIALSGLNIPVILLSGEMDESLCSLRLKKPLQPPRLFFNFDRTNFAAPSGELPAS
jgi:hypothetical protein